MLSPFSFVLNTKLKTQRNATEFLAGFYCPLVCLSDTLFCSKEIVSVAKEQSFHLCVPKQGGPVLIVTPVPGKWRPELHSVYLMVCLSVMRFRLTEQKPIPQIKAEDTNRFGLLVV